MKRIEPSRIQSIKASFDASSEEIPENFQSLIDAPVTGKLEECVKDSKASMENLIKAVSSLDAYLDSVAQAFQDADDAMAQSIDTWDIYEQAPQTETSSQKQDRYIETGKTPKERHDRRKQMELYQDFP